MSGKDDTHLVFNGKPRPCAECGSTIEKGDLCEAGGRSVCLACRDLDGMVFLQAGDAALTRRARAASNRCRIVRRNGRPNSKRKGILVERDALEAAEARCRADADERRRRREKAARRRKKKDEKYVQRFARKVRAMYPSCPDGREKVIARHACKKHSRRVGRTAAAKRFEDRAVRKAVRAHVRHNETEYDRLISRIGRERARDRVRDRVLRVLREWEDSGT